MIRLDKFLADQKIGTRSEVKTFVKKGQVTVNGEVVKSADLKVDPLVDQICYLGKLLSYEEFSFYILNKPAGVITASKDSKETTVMEFFENCPNSNLYPVGRLDKDTVGLLLVTNHGPLGHKMLAPKSHVDKVYYCGLKAPLRDEDVTRLEQGVDIGEDELTRPAVCEIVSDDRFEGACKLTISEGKFHQVKRMMQAVGNEVVYLRRISFGPLLLDESLKEGEYRKCTEEEIEALMKLL